MYAVTALICNMNAKGIEVKSEEALKDTLMVMKLIFTPINSLIVLSTIGNTFGKVKDNVIGTDKAGKRLIILAIAFILILVFESNYIGSFVRGLLG